MLHLKGKMIMKTKKVSERKIVRQVNSENYLHMNLVFGNIHFQRLKHLESDKYHEKKTKFFKNIFIPFCDAKNQGVGLSEPFYSF